MSLEISGIEAKLSKARQIKQGMMPDLLTRRFDWYERQDHVHHISVTAS